MPGPDYYAILQISPQASEEEVRRAYQHLARKYHPDINPGDERAQAIFRRLREAYEVLSDPVRRFQYERSGLEEFSWEELSAPKPGKEGETRAPEEESALEQTLNRLSRSVPPRLFREQRDVEHHVSISLAEALRGTQVMLIVKRRDLCPQCRGEGVREGRFRRSCPRCGGEGHRRHQQGALPFTLLCGECEGRGWIWVGDCTSCAGTGLLERVEELQVQIPAGVNTGSRLRVPGKGHRLREEDCGDLVVVVHVQSHPFFQRQGQDVLCTIPVTVAEAALGATIEVPTLYGRASLRIPPGTQPGQRFRLARHGLPSSAAGPRGDQIVTIEVLIPPAREERSRQILQEWALLHPENPRRRLLALYGGLGADLVGAKLS